jgi:dipeptidyl aminopeptidase/acylaminoacyl peptidase
MNGTHPAGRLPLLLLFLGVAAVSQAHDDPAVVASTSSKRPLTAADTVTLRRVLSDDQSPGKEPIHFSPDGKRYYVAVTQGDLKRNGTWLEILSGRTDSIETARPQTVARLFTTSTGIFQPTHVADYCIGWLDDNERVAILWNRGGAQPTQLMTVDVRTRQVQTLTHHPTDVMQFAAGRGNAILYTALVKHSKDRATELLRSGFAVSNREVYSLLEGHVDGWAQWTEFETFVSPGRGQPFLKVIVNGRGRDHWYRTVAQFAPDGRRVIVDGHPASFPDEWDRYSDQTVKLQLPSARQQPEAPTAITQLFVIDTRRATSHPLWNVPIMTRPAVVWSPSGRTVLLGPTFLPAGQADAAGLAGNALAEVDTATGNFWQIPIPADAKGKFRPLRWHGDDVIELGSDETRLYYRKTAGQWHPVPEMAKPEPAMAAVRIELRQDLNTPPALFAVETATGREEKILDLNPELRSSFMLGRVEIVHWKDKEERGWTGRLYYPVHYTPDRRFPLVIQTHGYSPTEFSLLGYERLSSNSAAQPLANHDIAVLQMQESEEGMVSPREPEIAMAGFEGAVEHFESTGLVDRNKVGLVGFSRTGWHIEYALTHSAFPYAAANVADNIDASYFQAGLNWGWSDEFSLDNGAPPYGEGLKIWLERAPGFNADKIHTPLRLQVDSGGLPFVVIDGWEMFSRLRDLRKPVELYVVPDIEHGVHGMVIPRQQLASRQGLVDWMEFWLNGHEDPDPKKAEQYARWRKLRELHDADRKTVSPGGIQ